MTLLRTFIVWLLLLALPYQGYASAAMMLCVPATAAMAMPSGPHDHAAMMAAMEHGGGDSTHAAAGDQASFSPDNVDGTGHAGHVHGGVKCGGSACCVAGAPWLAGAITVPALPGVSSAIPFHSEFLRAVDLAHPERPPQGNFV
nr:hypothetical protein [uncultured Duganella sp.]